ncbi:endonuclease/exonuclease/phosphatase family protein [Altibacter sp.]|uniref:endonuclease/exonuclease/phosphatase family protein n=1 Tax=Altibacter sp. TaxID=2024823 RepID=UPI000C8B66C2|nr:endonuclease/exonuclease/phosphatase family protein [Altibacter sp.]MAP53378.1 endonuclease [Altibacter sp.]
MRSKKGLLHSVIYWCNIIAVILLVISFVLPYLRPSDFPTLSLLSLAVSPLLLLNVLFMIYWMFRGKRTFLVSMVVLIIAYFHFNPFFEFSSEGDASEYAQSLSLLSYNVRLFNAYEKDPSEGVSETIHNIIQNDTPDIICIQEYYRESTFDFSEYPYQFIHFKDGNNKLGHAIFSKFPFAKTGAFDFDNSHNNTLFADVVKGKDTVRIYNLHLQSLGILPRVEFLQEGDKERLRKRMSRAFVMQEGQSAAILAHKAMSPYPVIICGDFNNTPFSYVYRKLQEEMTDAFVERGRGIGTTFKFDGYPMRIDYILASDRFDVLQFKTIKKSFSDHYPVKATLGWGTQSSTPSDD